MSTTIRIKGSELPDKWRKQANVDPDEFLRITIEPESERDDEVMPPEERISDKLIAEVRKSIVTIEEKGNFKDDNGKDSVLRIYREGIKKLEQRIQDSQQQK